MENEKMLWEICMKIYKELYKKSVPKADLDKLIAKGETLKKDWFMKYHLEEDKQERIITKLLSKYKLADYEKQKIIATITLGCSPNYNKTK